MSIRPHASSQLTRHAFHRLVGVSDAAVFLVVHCASPQQAVRNAMIGAKAGVEGLLLINQEEIAPGVVCPTPIPGFVHAVRAVRSAVGEKMHVGVNLLAQDGEQAFPLLAGLHRSGCRLDSYWADDACVDERLPHPSDKLRRVQQARKREQWPPLYFGGIAFKKQRPVPECDWPTAAHSAWEWQGCDVLTTSGPATGVAADTEKVRIFRKAAPQSVLAVGSGVTPENVHAYLPFVDALIVATGVSTSFHEVCPAKLSALLSARRGFPWYANLMLPRSPSRPKTAWLDPSAIYRDAGGWASLLSDAKRSALRYEVGGVAGVDAAGYVLGGALAALLDVPFYVIRKEGKLPLETLSIAYKDYSAIPKRLEIPRGLSPPRVGGVLLVDQWIETGGTIRAASALLRAAGIPVVASLVIAAESQGLSSMRPNDPPVISLTTNPSLQQQLDRQQLESFSCFAPHPRL